MCKFALRGEQSSYSVYEFMTVHLYTCPVIISGCFCFSSPISGSIWLACKFDQQGRYYIVNHVIIIALMRKFYNNVVILVINSTM